MAEAVTHVIAMYVCPSVCNAEDYEYCNAGISMENELIWHSNIEPNK